MIDAAQEKQRQYKDEAREKIVERVREEASKYGLSIADLFPANLFPEMAGSRRRRTDAGQPLKPKYRNPDTGESWSGRGVMSKWLREFVEQGRNKEEFRVKEEGE